MKSNKMEDKCNNTSVNPRENDLEINGSSNNVNENFSSGHCLKDDFCTSDTNGESKLTSISDFETKKCYKCGSCGEKFKVINQLHNHFLGNHSSGSYHYDHFIRTAFPKFDAVCVGTQTPNTLQENHRRPRKQKLKKKLSPENNHNEKFSNCKKKFISTADQCNEKENATSGISVSLSTIKMDLDDDIQIDSYQSDGTDDYFNVHEEYNTKTVIDGFLKDSDTHSSTDAIDIGTSEDTVDQSDSTINNGSRTEKKKLRKNEKKGRSHSHSMKEQSSGSDPTVKPRSRKQLKPKNVREHLVTSPVEPAAAILNHKISAISESSELKTVTDVIVDPLPNENCRCSICDAVFSFKRGLLRHEQMKHGADMKFECQICQHKFMREYNLHKHIKCVHTVGRGHKSIEQNKTKNEEEKQSNTAAEIDVKSEMTGRIDEAADSGQDKMEVKVEKSPSKKSNTILSSKLPHTCEICGYTMPKSKMDVHRRLHTGERPYICSLCGKGLISQNKLKRHLLIHSEVKKHTCDTCGAGFQMKYKLRMHQHIHTGKKPYLCSICGVEFNHSSNLATHTRCVHRQIKPFVCTKCGGRYAKRSQLDDHVLSHSDEKQFTCRYCGKSFKYYKGMRRHEKNHTEEKMFPCDKCDSSFSQKENLDHHRQTHDAQTLPCQKCGKEFTDTKSLTDHESTVHSKVKPFQCLLCKERYQLVHQYYTHMLAAHNIDKEKAHVIHYEQAVPRSNPSTVLGQSSDVQIDTNLPLMYESGSLPEISVSISTPAKGANKIIPSLSVSQVVSGIMEENRSEINALTRVATENLRMHSEDIRDDEKFNVILPGVNPMIEHGQDISIPPASNQNVAMETNNAINTLGFHPDGPMRALAHLSHVSHVLHGDGHQGQQQDGGSTVTMGQLHLGEGMRLSHDAQSMNPSLLLLNDNLRMQQGLAVSRATPVSLGDMRFKDVFREPGSVGTSVQAAGDFVCVRDGWWGRRDEGGHSEGPVGGGAGAGASWEHSDGHC